MTIIHLIKSLNTKYNRYSRHHYLVNFTFLALSLVISSIHTKSQAEDNAWRQKSTVQGYAQFYNDASARDMTLNAGAYLLADYLDSGTIGIGYHFTFLDLAGNADLTEHLFYATARYHLYSDLLPGKTSLRMDAYRGINTLSYDINNPPSHIGGGGMGGSMKGGTSSTTIEQDTDFYAYQGQLEFINYQKTFYLDIGYAYSEYDGTSTTKVDQITPTLGFGWNNSFDWVQLRTYLIDTEDLNSLYADDQFESVEIKYTHWYEEKPAPYLELMRITLLAGERTLAVDPDAGVIYSTADKQTGTASIALQWKTSQTDGFQALLDFTQYENDVNNEDYNSILLYINFQHSFD